MEENELEELAKPENAGYILIITKKHSKLPKSIYFKEPILWQNKHPHPEPF
jgi:hypothetical protein